MSLPTERGFYEPTHRDDIYIPPEALPIRVPWYFNGEYFMDVANKRVDDLTGWRLTRLVPLSDEDRTLIAEACGAFAGYREFDAAMADDDQDAALADECTAEAEKFRALAARIAPDQNRDDA